MTVDELIQKWGEAYIIETQVSDKDFQYNYTVEYLNRVSAEDNDFLEDLKSVLVSFYIGNAVINAGAVVPTLELEWIGQPPNYKGYNIEDLDFNTFFSLITRKATSSTIVDEKIALIRNEIMLAEKFISENLFNWTLDIKRTDSVQEVSVSLDSVQEVSVSLDSVQEVSVSLDVDPITIIKKIDYGNFKNEWMTDMLTSGSDVRIKTDIVSAVTKQNGEPEVSDLFNGGGWLTKDNIGREYLAKWKESVYTSTADPITGIATGSYRYVDMQEMRMEVVFRYVFNLLGIKAHLESTLNKIKIKITGTELIYGDPVVEDGVYGKYDDNVKQWVGTLPSDDTERSLLISKLEQDAFPQIGETLKEYTITEGPDTTSLKIVPYIEGREYDKDFSISKIINKP